PVRPSQQSRAARSARSVTSWRSPVIEGGTTVLALLAQRIRPVFRQAPLELAKPLRINEGSQNPHHFVLIPLTPQAAQKPEFDHAFDVRVQSVEKTDFVARFGQKQPHRLRD